MSEHPITERMLAEKDATGHSIFGPSAAHRWMRCPASLIQGHLAGDRPSFYAAEGTVAHWLGEDWLLNGSPWRHEGTVKVVDGFEITIDEEMISHVETYVERVSTAPGKHYVEVKVDLSEYTPVPSFGTSDHISASWQKLRVKDFKYGKVWVDAAHNEQGQAYALGAFDELDWFYDFQEIEIEIIQPRRDNFDVWTITRAELLEFGERYREAAHKAWDPEAPYNPDPIACEYCPARTTCPALATVLLETAKSSFDDFDDDGSYEISQSTALAIVEQEIISEPRLPEFHEVSLDQLARVYQWRPIFDKWFRELYEYLLHQLDLGNDVLGQKLGKGRAGNRAWTDAEAARRMLRTNGVAGIDLYDHKFVTPATASKLLRLSRGGTIKENDALLADFVFQPPGKLTMIPAGDSRPSLPSAASAFDDVEEGK